MKTGCTSKISVSELIQKKKQKNSAMNDPVSGKGVLVNHSTRCIKVKWSKLNGSFWSAQNQTSLAYFLKIWTYPKQFGLDFNELDRPVQNFCYSLDQNDLDP